MDELLALSRGVAAELASEFRGNPRGELAAWLHIALQREGLVASLYDKHSVEARLQVLPKPLARSALAKLNGICANEETHVGLIRALLAGDSPWARVLLEEGWGRLQGLVLGQLASTNALAQAIALILLELGAGSDRERAAGRAVAGLDLGGFLKCSRTLEITAVESYQRIAALLAVLRRRKREAYSLALHLKILRILRDEQVHRDVLYVLCRAFGGDRARDEPEAALPASISMQPISSRADLNAGCRTILTFHYGAVVPTGAPPEEALRTAADYWRWQMVDCRRRSYLVDRQRQDLLRPEGDILLLGTAGLQHVARGLPYLRSRNHDRRLIAQLIASKARPTQPENAARV